MKMISSNSIMDILKSSQVHLRDVLQCSSLVVFQYKARQLTSPRGGTRCIVFLSFFIKASENVVSNLMLNFRSKYPHHSKTLICFIRTVWVWFDQI